MTKLQKALSWLGPVILTPSVISLLIIVEIGTSSAGMLILALFAISVAWAVRRNKDSALRAFAEILAIVVVGYWWLDRIWVLDIEAGSRFVEFTALTGGTLYSMLFIVKIIDTPPRVSLS